jgi:hypothetical protein
MQPAPMLIDCVMTALLCAAAGFGLGSVVALDRLLRAEYERHREQWIADGGPCGIFWRPGDGQYHRNRRAVARVSWSWLFRRPVWMAEDSGSRRTLAGYRTSTFALWVLAAIMAGFLLFVLFERGGTSAQVGNPARNYNSVWGL